MTCANHPDRPNTAFCQHCGKPICGECTRTAGTAIFCEPCLAERLSTAPRPVSPIDTGEPSPVLAGILGFIPGVGAMYNGQYAKGLVHVIIFAILVSLSHEVGIFGIFVAGWVFYQVIDAYHTARARRDGTPLPNPFGLNDFGDRLGYSQDTPGNVPPPPPSASNPPPTSGPAPNPTAPPPNYNYQYSYSYQYPPPPAMPTDEEIAAWQRHRFPAGAVVLIALGLIFLLGNLHVLPHNSAREIFPILLMAAGVWVFGRRMAEANAIDQPNLRRMQTMRAAQGGTWFFLIGLLWLLDSTGTVHWRYSWPIILIAAGAIALIRRGAFASFEPLPVPPASPEPPAHSGTSIVPKTYPPDQEN